MSLQLPGSQTFIPLTSLEVVTHIGSLNPADKGLRGASYEGAGLSFSIHPEDWEAIAQLGGNDWWEVDLTGRQFVDGHQALRLASEGLATWGQANGLITSCQEFAVAWEDSEWEEMVEMVVPTLELAQAEVEDMAEVEGMAEDEFKITQRQGWAPTVKLLEAMRHMTSRAGEPCPDALQSVLTVWAEHHGLDGVWWEDTYSPEQLSAPRGVIFPDKVPELSFKKAREASARPRGLRP